MKDYEFFLKQGNFMKVVDTLEKYQQRVVNVKSESGKEFIQFKRQLYQIYEVQNRSIDEHEQFSSKLERQNLRWLYQANLDFIGEMERINWLDKMVDHGALKGSVFRAKALSARRVKGLAGFGVAGLVYMNMTSLALMLGPTVPTLSILGSLMYGAKAFYETETISRIDYITEGEFAGSMRATVQKSPLVSYSIIVHPKYTRSLCAVGADDLGEDDAEANILSVEQYFDEATGQIVKTGGMFRVPADAYRDKSTMEWIYAVKDSSAETDELFNDLVAQRHRLAGETGGLTGLRKLVVEQTGYANIGDESEITNFLASEPEAADATLIEMTHVFGQEKLDKMSSQEFYRLYRDFSLSKQ